jgi:hypothetical protein
MVVFASIYKFVPWQNAKRKTEKQEKLNFALYI